MKTALFCIFSALTFTIASADQSNLSYINQLAHPVVAVSDCPTPAKDTDPNFCRQYPSDAVCECNQNPLGHGICARGVNAIFQALMSTTGQQPPYTMAEVKSACTTEHNRNPSVDPVQCSDAWVCFYNLNSGEDTSGNRCNFASAPTPNQGPCASVPTV